MYYSYPRHCFVPAIQAEPAAFWMPGTSPGMTGWAGSECFSFFRRCRPAWIAGIVPAIQAELAAPWMPGTSPGMTDWVRFECYYFFEGAAHSVIAGLVPAIQTAAMARTFFVYLLASQRNGTLYVGVTNNLERRMLEHKAGLKKSFTKQYNVKMLVWYEEHPTALSAIQREKNIKHWPRKWKLNLIEASNPDWEDLAPEGGVW